MEKKLRRSTNDRKIAGVCGGIAEFFNFDSTVIRIIWAISILFFGTGFLAYLLCILIIPLNDVKTVSKSRWDSDAIDADYSEVK